MIKIYTDGAYNPALDQGGWAAVLVEGEQKQAFSGAVKKTTSNRMEITAALEGIRRTEPGAEMTVYTDSQYLFNCTARGWRRRANQDLWRQMDEATRPRRVQWEWIRRDADEPHHHEAHNLATNLASPKGKTPQDGADGELTHVDNSGRPRMVDVTGKADTQREAVARCRIRMKAATLARLKKGKMPKGDVLAAAQLAGIMAAKRTPHIVPLCHPVLIGDVEIGFTLDEKAGAVEINTKVKSVGKTGVEMEALTATTVTALTIYDMCKAIDRAMVIDGVRLIRKSGGKSGTIELE